MDQPSKLSPELEAMIEIYTPERKAEFLLNNSWGPDEYRVAVQESLELGVDPTRLQHLLREYWWQDPELFVPAGRQEARG